MRLHGQMWLLMPTTIDCVILSPGQLLTTLITVEAFISHSAGRNYHLEWLHYHITHQTVVRDGEPERRKAVVGIPTDAPKKRRIRKKKSVRVYVCVCVRASVCVCVRV